MQGTRRLAMGAGFLILFIAAEGMGTMKLKFDKYHPAFRRFFHFNQAGRSG